MNFNLPLKHKSKRLSHNLKCFQRFNEVLKNNLSHINEVIKCLFRYQIIMCILQTNH